MGLSTLHIRPRPPRPLSGVADYMKDHKGHLLSKTEQLYVDMADGVGEYVLTDRVEFAGPVVEIRVGGSLVVAKTGLTMGNQGDIGGDRGDVLGYSSDSRRRLMRLIASTEKQQKPLFVTMTYPDEFDEAIETWKRDIKVFGQRFLRAFPDASYIWRIEFKERQSGVSEGKIAPHFHLLVWGVTMQNMKRFITEAWFGVVNSGNEDHYRAGTRCEYVREWRGTMRYTSKYITKTDTFPPGWQGRVWGVVGRDKLPLAPLVTIMVSTDIAIKVVRLGRKFIGAKGRSFVFGLTWIIDGDRLLDYLEFLYGER